MSTTRYYYANEQNQPVGPFTAADLWKFRELAIITHDTLVCVEDGSEWIPLATLTGTSASPSGGPPPLPASARTAQPQAAAPSGDHRTSYQRTAETVGMVPDFDGKRNRLQLAITAPVVLVCALSGLLTGGIGNAVFWGFLGLLVAVLVSGAVLMVMGWKKG